MKPIDVAEVRSEVLSWMNYWENDYIPTRGERGVVVGLMNNALLLGGDMEQANYRRHKVFAWLFRDLLKKPHASVVSSKELTDQMWWSLCKYTDAHKDQDTNAWVARDGFDEEVRMCWQAMEEWERIINGQLGFEGVL
jgi:hypothetical protein